MVINLSLFDDVVIEERTPARRRYQFKFWLNISRPDELVLAQHADNLKSRRQWQPFIRDAFKLLVSLHEKRVDVLVSLFPWIDEYFKTKYAPPAQDLTAVLKQQADILAQLAQRPDVYSKEYISPMGETPRLSAPISPTGETLPSIFATEPAADPSEARASFAGGLGNLFDDIDPDDDF